MNISSYVSDTFARISWNAGDSQQDSQFYVAYMNNRKLPSPASSCLGVVFLKQTITVTTKSTNQQQHAICGTTFLIKSNFHGFFVCHIAFIWIWANCRSGQWSNHIEFPPTFTLLLRDSGCLLVAVVNLLLIGANGGKIPRGSLPCLSFGWCELLRFCCLCTLR